MNFEYCKRAKVALILLIALVFVSDIYFAVNEKIFNTTIDPSYNIILHQRRFERVQETLPRRGLVGYLGDKNDAFEDASVQRAYYITQYILSPVVIANTVDLPLVIGNFYQTDSRNAQPTSNGLVLISDFHNGVQLLRGRQDQSTWK